MAVNLYPFEQTIAKPNVTLAEAIENIDIGGPSMLRSAAKNHESVTVVVDPADYAEVAETLGRNEAAVRQLASRARAHVQDTRPRFTVSQEDAARLASAFMAAAASGDMAALSAVLAEDAVMVTDGGGKRNASLRPLIGRADIVRLLEGLAWRHDGQAWPLTFRAVRINGYPGVVMERDPASPYYDAGLGIDKQAVVRDALARDPVVAFAGDSFQTDGPAARLVAPEMRFATGQLARRFAAAGGRRQTHRHRIRRAPSKHGFNVGGSSRFVLTQDQHRRRRMDS